MQVLCSCSNIVLTALLGHFYRSSQDCSASTLLCASLDTGVCSIPFPKIRKKSREKGKKPHIQSNFGFPPLYCCSSFDHMFCCCRELRDQNSRLTNLPPKEKANGKTARGKRTPLKEGYVCLETEQHIKNRTAAAGRPRS